MRICTRDDCNGVVTGGRNAKYCSTECSRAAQREKALERYADPAFRSRWKEGIVRRSESDAWRDRQQRGSQKRSNRPEYHHAMMQGIKRRHKDIKWRVAMQNNPLWKRGEENPNWKGTQDERQVATGRAEYKAWRRAVFERDRYTCQHCQQRGGSLHAHHMKSWVEHPDLRYEVSNGLTLCVDCHSDLHGHYIPGRLPQDRKPRKLGKIKQLRFDF
jgi:5-methylcytosine-specific restriction endonuclease McrA